MNALELLNIAITRRNLAVASLAKGITIVQEGALKGQPVTLVAQAFESKARTLAAAAGTAIVPSPTRPGAIAATAIVSRFI
jgi:hypothetical protein